MIFKYCCSLPPHFPPPGRGRGGVSMPTSAYREGVLTSNTMWMVSWILPTERRSSTWSIPLLRAGGKCRKMILRSDIDTSLNPKVGDLLLAGVSGKRSIINPRWLPRKKDIYRHCPRPIPIICHRPELPCFSFKQELMHVVEIV